MSAVYGDRRSCHAEGRGFESHQPLRTNPAMERGLLFSGFGPMGLGLARFSPMTDSLIQGLAHWERGRERFRSQGSPDHRLLSHSVPRIRDPPLLPFTVVYALPSVGGRRALTSFDG